MCGSQMILKSFDSNSPIRFKWQKCRGNALHFAPKLLPLNDRLDFHHFAFAIFNRFANSELL